MEYQYTYKWFEDAAKRVWDNLIPQVAPKRVLEVGSFEGASTCYLTDYLGRHANAEIHCVDTWEGGAEHGSAGSAPADMSGAEKRFWHNVSIARSLTQHQVKLVVHKGSSDVKLAELLIGGKRSYFDFVYIDGSHQAADVLCDAILGFKLLRIGGVMAFDDYLWAEPLPSGVDPIRCPKAAVDEFTNLFCRKLVLLRAPLYQLYIQKTAE